MTTNPETPVAETIDSWFAETCKRFEEVGLTVAPWSGIDRDENRAYVYSVEQLGGRSAYGALCSANWIDGRQWSNLGVYLTMSNQQTPARWLK